MDGHEKLDKSAPTDGESLSKADAGSSHAVSDLFERDQSAVRLSFVVQFALPHGAEAFSGRVQHLLTADGGNFSSPNALIEILRRVLERTQARERSDE